MSEVLALPSGATPATDREHSTVATSTLLGGLGVLMLFASLAAVYLTLRHAAKPFPPEGVSFDFYLSRTLVITVAMASVFIEWAAYGIRKGFRGHALVAFGVTALQSVATMVGLWYLLDAKLGYAIVDSPYAQLGHTMVVLSLAAIGAATIFIVLAALRAIGHQLDGSNYPLMRATATAWHVAAASWVIVHYVLYITK